MAEHDIEERDWREIARVVAVVLVALLLAGFVIENRHSVEVDFIVVDRDAPLFLVIFLATALGVLLGALVRRLRRR